MTEQIERTDTDDNTSAELREQIRVVAKDVKKLGEAAKHTAAAKIESAREQADQALEAARRKKVHLEERASRAISERPFTSVLLSAGIGVAAACLWNLRSRRGTDA